MVHPESARKVVILQEENTDRKYNYVEMKINGCISWRTGSRLELINASGSREDGKTMYVYFTYHFNTKDDSLKLDLSSLEQYFDTTTTFVKVVIDVPVNEIILHPSITNLKITTNRFTNLTICGTHHKNLTVKIIDAAEITFNVDYIHRLRLYSNSKIKLKIEGVVGNFINSWASQQSDVESQILVNHDVGIIQNFVQWGKGLYKIIGSKHFPSLVTSTHSNIEILNSPALIIHLPDNKVGYTLFTADFIDISHSIRKQILIVPILKHRFRILGVVYK